MITGQQLEMERGEGIVPDGCVILKSKFRSLTLRRHPDPLPNLPRTTQARLVFWDPQIRGSSCLIKHGLSINEKGKANPNWMKKKRTGKLGVNLNSTQGSLALNYVNGKWLPHSDLWFFSVSFHWSHSSVSCSYQPQSYDFPQFQVNRAKGCSLPEATAKFWGPFCHLDSEIWLSKPRAVGCSPGPHLDHMDQEAGMGRILS